MRNDRDAQDNQNPNTTPPMPAGIAPGTLLRRRPPAHVYAAAAAVASGALSLTAASRAHDVPRHTVANRLRYLIEGGMIQKPELSKTAEGNLRLISEGLPDLLAKLATGAFEALQSLPARPDQRTKEQMAQAEQALRTLDRLGMMPEKPKTLPDSSAGRTTRFIDVGNDDDAGA